MTDNNYDFIDLDWDTNFFEIPCNKIILHSYVNEITQEKIIDKNRNFVFTSIINVNDNIENNIWLSKKTNAYLIDTNIKLKKKLKTDCQLSQSEDDRVLILNKFDGNEGLICDIAEKSFLTSRFVVDPNLDKNKSLKMYSEWVKNSFRREDKFFAVYKHQEVIKGFMIFSLESDKTANLDLWAVNPDYRRQHIGEYILHAVERFLVLKGYEYFKLGTQKKNFAALNLYFKNDFKYYACDTIYHLWKEE